MQKGTFRCGRLAFSLLGVNLGIERNVNAGDMRVKYINAPTRACSTLICIVVISESSEEAT